MKEMKRILSLVLCFVMLVGMMPAIALNADAADTTQYLFFATDRHENTTIIDSLLDQMSTVGTVEYVCLGGDMVNGTSGFSDTTVLNEVSSGRSQLTAANVDIVAGNHDENCSNDSGTFHDASGWLYSGEDYHVYGVVYDDLNNASSAQEAAQAFVEWGSALTDGKVIIVMSHVPLHSTRNNSGANYWHEALNDVAADESGNIVRDVIFLHGHNHTIDQENYSYAVNEGFTVNNYSGSERNYYTYGTAGYLNANNEATLIAINDTTVTLTRYNSSGSTETYATVTRVASGSTEDGSGTTNPTTPTNPTEGEDEGNTDSSTSEGVHIEGASGTGYIYTSTATADGTTGYILVSNGYALYNNGGSISATAVTVTNNVVTINDSSVDVADLLWTIDSDGDVMNDGYYLLRESGANATAMSIDTSDSGTKYSDWTYANDTLTVIGGSSSDTTYYAYYDTDNSAFYTDPESSQELKFYGAGSVSTSGTYYLDAKDVTTTSALSTTTTVTLTDVITFVADGSTTSTTVADLGGTYTYAINNANGIIAGVSTDGVVTINPNVTGTATVDVTYTWTVDGTEYSMTDTATIKVTEVVDQGVVDNYTSTTTGSEDKTVYVLVDAITEADNYLIVNTNQETTSAHLLTATSSGVTDTSGVTVLKGTDADGNTIYYIESPAAATIWAASSSTGGTLYNSSTGRYLRLRTGNSAGLTTTSKSSEASTFVSSGNTLYRSVSDWGSTTNYYVRYNSSWTYSTSSQTVYVYKEDTIKVDTTVEATGTVALEAGDPIKQVVSGETALTLDPTILFAGKDATATFEALGGTYTVEYVGGDNILTNTTTTGLDVTLNGNLGTATVRVKYTWTVGDKSYAIWDTTTITAIAPYYSIELHKAELTKVEITEFAEGVTYYTFDSTTNTYQVATEYKEGTTYYTTPVEKGDVITETIALKGIEKDDKYSVWAVVKEHTAANPDGKDLGDVDDNRLYWTVSNTSIATIDPATGVLTFTGDAYGTINVTVYYLDENGNSLCSDTITISVTDSLYVVPGDGTNDFPEYPNQGAIRFDKTAVAQGNFSATGIAKVELSMTGVPYGTSTPTDVVIMVDMTTSMSNSSSVDDAQTAIENMLEALVYDAENDAYDKNIYVQVWSFKSDDDGEDVAFVENLSRRNITSAQDLTDAQDAITFGTSGNDGNGTCYDEATKKMESIVASCTTDNVVAVFASDGEPTRYAYLNSSGTVTETGSLSSSSWFNTDGSTTTSYLTEYYTYKLKSDKIPVYTVGINIEDETEAAWILEHMSSEYDALGTTVSTEAANANTDYFFTADANTTTDDLSEVFEKIAASIREAATNVVVEDKIESHYDVNFSLPDGVTATEAGMDDFYIQVVGYELDDNNERKENPTVLEKFLFNDDGTIVHTIGSTTCESCAHVTKTDGVVTAIDGTYFEYTSTTVTNAAGETITEEFLTWKADKLDRTELALQYFVYLDKSAGDVPAAEQVAAGTYNTNEYATITYTNHLGHECQQYFPVPSMTWKGAKVTYVFYLVNSAGQPVNRAGKVVPFAEAVYVTTPVTYDVTWNEATGTENILAKDIFATAGVPDVYQLYDKTASYVIRVYQTENVDNSGVNGNYFEISGADDKLVDSVMDTDTTVDNSTTKVFNTKAGQKYDEYGVYSVYEVGTKLTDGTNTFTTDYQATDIDYANTTVAFAVVWTPALTPDAVVVDYGLDVVIDVITNDNMAAGVVGIRTDAPSGVDINDGTYRRDASTTKTTVDVKINADQDENGVKELVIGTATVENLTSVRFSLNKTNGTQFNVPAEFYYEADVNYYTYDAAGTATLNTTSMYSSVTVIPATTIYYEDSFIQFASFTNTEMKDEEGNVLTDDDGNVIKEFIQDEKHGWTTDGVVQNGEQDQDRPGESKISADLDADNNYGYDEAYESMSTHSMGSAAKFTVTADTRGEAYFTFYGTGFDVIGLTSNTTGTLLVQVTDAEGNTVENRIVDTYYGYTRNAAGEWIVTNEVDNALYQVPVMKVVDLPYGKYSVKIMAVYGDFFNHTANAGNYTLYLDAIRIYDPTGNQNSTANNAYLQDGEGYPEYFEVRNQIISKETFDSLNDASISGVVFIDGKVQAPTIQDYTAYGPNNEVYLSKDQAIAFDLNAAVTVQAGELKKIQLAVKTVGGTGKLEVYGIKGGVETECLNVSVSTATDMYYDITALEGMTVVIRSTGDAIISITNVKVTYTAAQPTTAAVAEEAEDQAPMMFSIRRSSAEAAVASMTEQEEIPETTVPETTEPEVTEPEATEPETTVPETEPTLPETEPTEPETEPTEPSVEEQVEEIIKVVEKIIKGILGRLFG